MLDKYVENDDPSKVRKSLLTIGLLTIFFANVQFSANELSVFGLKVVIDSQRLVALGQIASAVLLAVFLLRSLPEMLNSIKDFQTRRLDSLERNLREDLNGSWGLDIPDPPEEGPDGELEQLESKVRFHHDRIEALFEKLSFWVSAFVFVCLDYALPIAVGIIATAYPYSLAELITQIAASSSQP